MPYYSEERKAAILKKLLPPHNQSVPALAKQEGVGKSTLYKWLDQSKQPRANVVGNPKQTKHWSPEAKFATVIETATLSEIEINEYCRNKGLYPEQIQAWKQACIVGQVSSAAQSKHQAEQIRQEQKKIRQLEKALARKDKALAEAAALLVLTKKFQAFYEEEEN